MNDDLDPKPLPPAEEQRLSAFLQADAAAGLDPRGGAEVAPEAAARREAIRRGFVSGGLESSLPASGGEAHRASTTEIRGGTISLDSLLPRRTRRVWPRVALAAAAVLIAVVAGRALIVGNSREPALAWSVRQTTGTGALMVNGRPQPPLLKAGDEVRFEGEGMADLICEGHLAIQLPTDGACTLPAFRPPARAGWRGLTGGRPQTAQASVLAGEVRFVTGAQFPGNHLRLSTRAAELEVTGTTFAVILNAESTCVCVLEGAVKLQPRAGAQSQSRAGWRVEAGTRRSVAVDGGTRIEPILPMERMKLEMLRDTAR
ncbi:MAG: FecR domain-containing protein [Candidatus Eisenbacteria bacterium]|nr:FecR domain-containing protein [Candidatus Eisenbacteria bacterium]